MQKGAVRRPFFLLLITCTVFLKTAEGLSGTGRGMLWSKRPILRDSAPRFLRMRLVGGGVGGLGGCDGLGELDVWWGELTVPSLTTSKGFVFGIPTHSPSS